MEIENNKEAINWYEKELGEAVEYLYDEMDEDRGFEALCYFIKNFPELKIDWLEAFEDIKYDLVKSDRIDDILFFINWYSSKFPDDYNRYYGFTEKALIEYYFFKKDYIELKKRIEFVKQNPVRGMDIITVQLLFQLIFYGLYDEAVDYSENIWKPIKESDELMGEAAYEFSNTICINNLQKYYEAYLNNQSYDRDGIYRKAAEMGFSNDKELFSKVISTVTCDLDYNYIKSCISKKNYDHMLHLNIQFLKFMYKEYGLPFIFSEWIWNFVANKKIFGKKKEIENWFYIDAKTLDELISYKYDYQWGINELQVFGQVWGFGYVLEFFKHYQLITEEQYDIMRENHEYFKSDMIKTTGSELWKMMFVLDWPVAGHYYPDSSEKLLFEGTFIKDENKAEEKVRKFISFFPVSERIQKELKIKKNDGEREESIYNEIVPYIKNEPEIGRNDPCPCGSGKKYKKCCMDKD